jgi:hypothetical protein
MRTSLKAGWLILLCSISWQSHALGNLFTTIDQRQTINKMREQGGVPLHQPSVEAPIVKINGFYYKSQDKREKGVVWINGKPAHSNEEIDGIVVEKLSEHNQTVNIELDGRRYSSVKAGEQMQRGSNKVIDAYQ